jgi:RNA polymerase sigma-70 factor, ECF subfamily
MPTHSPVALPVRVVAVTEEAPALPAPASPTEPAPLPVAPRDPLRPLPKFETVFAELAPYVMRMLPRLGIAPSDIEDVCQEVFVTVHAKLPTFEGRSAVRTWVYGICLRVASNHRDRAYRRREQPRAELPVQSAAPRQERELSQQRTLVQLDAALGSLLPAQREAFVLHAIEELDVKEIAEVQGVSKFTVYARLYAARKHLQASFAGDPAVWRTE